MKPPLPAEIRDILVCPRCHGALTDAGPRLRCLSCRVAYPVSDGIPVLIIDAASQLDSAGR